MNIMKNLIASNKFHIRVLEREDRSFLTFIVEDYIPIGKADYSNLKGILLSIVNSLKSLYSP